MYFRTVDPKRKLRGAAIKEEPQEEQPVQEAQPATRKRTRRSSAAEATPPSAGTKRSRRLGRAANKPDWASLTHAGLVKQVNVDREPSRVCPNLQEHGHFFCSECGEVTDIEFKQDCKAKQITKLPKGTVVEQLVVSLKGTCPSCAKEHQKNN